MKPGISCSVDWLLASRVFFRSELTDRVLSVVFRATHTLKLPTGLAKTRRARPEFRRRKGWPCSGDLEARRRSAEDHSGLQDCAESTTRLDSARQEGGGLQELSRMVSRSQRSDDDVEDDRWVSKRIQRTLMRRQTQTEISGSIGSGTSVLPRLA